MRPRLALGVAAALALFLSCGPPPVGFTVTFEDARGLEAGDELVYKGVVVGRVEAVTIDPTGTVKVSVEIQPEHLAAIYREADFAIESDGAAGAVMGSRRLLMTDNEGPRTTVKDGDVVEGYDGSLKEAIGRLREAWGAAKDAAKELAKEAQGYAEEVRDLPETQEFVAELKTFGQDAERLGKDSFQTFKDEQLPVIKEKAERVRDKLLSEGRKEEARQFWTKFQAWLDEVAKAPPPPEDDDEPAKQ